MSPKRPRSLVEILGNSWDLMRLNGIYMDFMVFNDNRSTENGKFLMKISWNIEKIRDCSWCLVVV